MSESGKCKHLTRPYCYRPDGQPGVGIDLASQGDPIVPWAFQLDLPQSEFDHYNSHHPPAGPIQLRGHADQLPVDSASLDFVFSSHLLEDYFNWWPVLREWVRVLKPGGHLIILLPDKERWNQAIRKGQPPNCAHKHESYPGELSTYAPELGLEVLEDRFTESPPGDYGLIFVGRKL